MEPHTDTALAPGRRDSPASTGRTAGRRLVISVFVLVAVAAGCAPGDGAAVEQPTFSFVIPAGSDDRIERGETLDILPRELVAQLDETIVITNQDDEAHLLGPWFLGPGETLRQRFTTPGVFEDACSVHPEGRFTVVVEAA